MNKKEKNYLSFCNLNENISASLVHLYSVAESMCRENIATNKCEIVLNKYFAAHFRIYTVI